jgi:hypothetical protein
MADIVPTPPAPEPVSALAKAKRELDAAVARIETEVAARGAPSRVGVAMLRDAIDGLKRAVPHAGAPKRK